MSRGYRACSAALLGLLLTTLSGCVTAPPEQVANLCEIFEEKGGWYKDARRAEKRWGVPISVMMAMTFQESSYQGRARPPRTKLLWVIPWVRPSSAYGYAQATNEAWRDYTRSTGRGGADRNDFGDAMDFVGWYNARSARMIGVRKDDAYSLYLAYHDGPTGFKQGTWKRKAWLKDAARRVSRRAAAYKQQLDGCRDELESPWWWPF